MIFFFFYSYLCHRKQSENKNCLSKEICPHVGGSRSTPRSAVEERSEGQHI